MQSSRQAVREPNPPRCAVRGEITPEVVDEVRELTSRVECRRRLLPDRAVVYFVLAVRNEVLRVRAGVEGPCRWVVAAA
ncbi:transposase domain-containing protein [Streptomyces sp. NBC_01320]|uniref:transposase domain-containing protein n=1 Tax=Streptomyces sp. NBC_01320 TaxID=2903824 RepID=UPI003FA37F78